MSNVPINATDNISFQDRHSLCVSFHFEINRAVENMELYALNVPVYKKKIAASSINPRHRAWLNKPPRTGSHKL